MIDVTVEVDTWCDCGDELEGTASIGKDGSITLEPCAGCIEKARDEGFEDGFDQGREEGYEQGKQDAADEQE